MNGRVEAAEGEVLPTEIARLERAHQELCTALTTLQSNVDLVRIELGHGSGEQTRVMVRAHLGEVERAVDRLERLAVQMRVWHEKMQGPT